MLVISANVNLVVHRTRLIVLTAALMNLKLDGHTCEHVCYFCGVWNSLCASKIQRGQEVAVDNL